MPSSAPRRRRRPRSRRSSPGRRWPGCSRKARSPVRRSSPPRRCRADRRAAAQGLLGLMNQLGAGHRDVRLRRPRPRPRRVARADAAERSRRSASCRGSAAHCPRAGAGPARARGARGPLPARFRGRLLASARRGVPRHELRRRRLRLHGLRSDDRARLVASRGQRDAHHRGRPRTSGLVGRRRRSPTGSAAGRARSASWWASRWPRWPSTGSGPTRCGRRSARWCSSSQARPRCSAPGAPSCSRPRWRASAAAWLAAAATLGGIAGLAAGRRAGAVGWRHRAGARPGRRRGRPRRRCSLLLPETRGHRARGHRAERTAGS